MKNVSKAHSFRLPTKILLGWMAALTISTASIVLASSTSNFTHSVNAGTLAVDIVDGSYVTVGSPSVAMSATTFGFTCQTSTGTFGTASQKIYVSNPDAADNGWRVDLAASATTAAWDSAGTDFDFNDDSGSGCTDGADTDSLGGQMTVNPSGATLAVGQCSTCVVTNVSKGDSESYVEGSNDAIDLLTGAANSDDTGDWTLVTVAVSQKVPAEQPVAADYDINMVLSITAL